MPSSIQPWLALAAVFTSQTASSYAALPKVDFDRMGKVAVAGSFAGIDFYGDSNGSSSPVIDASASTILLRDQSGSLTPVGSTNEGGSVVAGCALGDTYYFAGEFSSLASQSASNIIKFDPSSSTFTALANGGLDGPVSALYCDPSSDLVWVGGGFRGLSSGENSGFGGSLAVYTPSSNTWSPPPFSGLSGASKQVNAIVPTTDRSSLLFAGSFITTYQGDTANNETFTSNPNVPQSSGATDFSTSLVPFPLSTAEINSGPSSTREGLNDITAILCPSGEDGPGSTWFAQEGSQAKITVRTFTQLNATGLRLGNTFHDGQSTRQFKVTSIPGNEVLTLEYNRPGTDEMERCSESCPLSLDSSVPYQDFLFVSSTIFGVEIIITEWNGAGAGLHLLQLLSNGAFASALDADNNESCYSPGSSNVSSQGDWRTQEVPTSIPATTQGVRVANVPVGSANSPSYTWDVYASASGEYEVFMLVPGCIQMQNCESRTTVDVTISPGGSMPDFTRRISQSNEADAKVLIYSGLIIPPEPDYLVHVTMKLSSSPEGSGANGQYIIIADRVVLALTSAIPPGESSGDGNGSTTSGSVRGFGLFEWPLQNDFGTVDATERLPNSTETPLNTLSQQLFVQLGNSTAEASSSEINAVAVVSQDTLFVAGRFDFENNAQNIVALRSGSLSVLAQNGVNGPVTALALYGDDLFVGGNFTSTADGSTSLSNIARYSLSANQWSSLGGGLDGAVTAIEQFGGRLSVAGNFSRALTSPSSDSGSAAGGFASWDIATSKWMNAGGLLVGEMTLAVNATETGDNGSQYIAGNVRAFLKYGADGMVNIETGDDGQGVLTPLGAKLDGEITNTNGNTKSKRNTFGKRHRWVDRLIARQNSEEGALRGGPAPAPSVLAGVFWTNTTSSAQVTIIGGNFSIPSTDGISLAIYDPETEDITPLVGEQIQGVVRALNVVGNKLFVGGQFTLSGVSGEGFAEYDLLEQKWFTNVPGFQASSGDVVVRSITTIPSQPETVVVAGSFSSAGSTQCQGICSFDSAAQSWSALGSNVQGQVSSVTYAGDNGNLLFAGGSLKIANQDAQVAVYSTQNQTWTVVGSLPGPVTAISANELDQNKIFAAGRVANGQGAFVSHWDGTQWSTIDLSLAADSNITQLDLVPLFEEHSVDGILQRNRMLWLSGSMSSQNFGRFSGALYDGKDLHPYLVTSTAEGEGGSIASFFRSFSTFSFEARRFLARGIVILISIALGAAVVFLIGLIGVLWALFARREDRSVGQDTIVEEEDDRDLDVESLHHGPSSILAHINAAARNTIIGPSVDETEYEKTHPGSPLQSHEGTLAAGALAGTHSPDTTIEDDVNRPAHARYSFTGDGPGELPMSSGSEVIVLNDQDPSWWFVRDKNTLQEGIVPASYLA